MSNYNAFSRGYIAAVIEPFLPGRAVNAMLIAYEALTPDKFVLLFVTHEDDQERYYVAYEVDYVSSIGEVKQDIELWSGAKIIKTLRPEQKSEIADDPSVYIDNIYKVYMCQVDQPTREFWRESYQIRSEEEIDKFLPNAADAVKKRIVELLDNDPRKSELTVRLRNDGNVDIYMRTMGEK